MFDRLTASRVKIWRKRLPWLAKAALVALAAFFIYTHREQLRTLDLQGLVAAAPSLFFAASIVVGVYALKSVVFIIPAMLIYVAVGAAFPLWQAVAINLVGIIVEVIITYYVGRFLGGDKVYEILCRNRKGEKLLGKLKNQTGVKALFVIRFLPTPIDFTSLFFGATKIPFRVYLLTSIAGIYPRVFFFTAFGDIAQRFLTQRRDFPPGMKKYAIAAIAIVLIAYYIQRRRARKYNNDGEEIENERESTDNEAD